MLAQNFMTAVELRITDAEQDALVRVLGMLERGEIHFGYADPTQLSAPQASMPTAFNMMAVLAQAPCGTVGCILGWARYVSGGRAFDGSQELKGDLARLFVLDGFMGAMKLSTISPAKAALALRNYLTTGEPDWSGALACRESGEVP